MVKPFRYKKGKNNHFLDLLVLGKREFNAMKKEESVCGDVPVIVKTHKIGSDYVLLDDFKDNPYKRIPLLDSRIDLILDLKPVDRGLYYHGLLERVHVHDTNGVSTLFSYAMREHHHLDDAIVINMFHSPQR